LPLSSLNLSLYRHPDRQPSSFPGGDLDPAPVIDSRTIYASDMSSPPTRPVIEVLRPSSSSPPRPSRLVDRPTDITIPAPHRVSNASSLGPMRLATLPEEYLPGIRAPFSAPPDSLEISRSSRLTLTHSPTNSLTSLPPEPLRQLSDVSLSTTASTGESDTHTGKSSRWGFPKKRSQTTPSGAPGSQPRRSASISNESIARPERPSKSQTISAKASQPSRSSTSLVLLPPSRKWVSVSPEVVQSMEKAANDTECILRPARDGRVSAGNLEGLVFRVITPTADSSRDDDFKSTFLTIYQLFATSDRLFEILKRRFESTSLDPAHMSSRYR
jgi:RasGEF N-terminal motif